MNKWLEKFAVWFNDTIMGSPWLYAFAIVFVVCIYAMIPVIGYSNWNTGLGLFSNTFESSFEFITGVGAIVAVVALHKKQHKEHMSSLKYLHDKIDKLVEGKNAGTSNKVR